MNRRDFINEMFKLAPTEYEGNFIEHLSTILDSYLKLIKANKDDNITDDWTQLCSEVEKLSAVIIESVRAIYQGQHCKAYSLLKEHVSYIYRTDYARAVISKGSNTYRMRVYDSSTKEKPSREGLFHIPLGKRGIVKTERYSAPGYPCLYLGTSSYVCWEEMNRPNLNKCYVARFHANKTVHVLNLTLPSDKYWDNNKYMLGFIIRFPFIIASMVKVRNADDTFKPEYIIPQLLTEWVIEQINTSKEETVPIGIHYTSVHVNEGFGYPVFMLDNFALPVQSPFEGNYSKELCDLFSVSVPTSDELEHAKGTYNSADIILVPPKNPNRQEQLAYSYKCSPFGVMERQLVGKEDGYPLGKIDYTK